MKQTAAVGIVVFATKRRARAACARRRQGPMRRRRRERLPDEWQEMVLEPVRFELHRDAELAAERCFGYDARRIACYYAHHYRIDEPRSRRRRGVLCRHAVRRALSRSSRMPGR